MQEAGLLLPLVGDRVQRVPGEPRYCPVTVMLRPEVHVVPEAKPEIGVASKVFCSCLSYVVVYVFPLEAGVPAVDVVSAMFLNLTLVASPDGSAGAVIGWL